MDTPRRRLFAPVSAGALALGLAIGLALPLAAPWLQPAVPDGDLPESFVGVLAAPEGGTGLVVSAPRHGRVLGTQWPVPPAMPAGRTLYLWTLDAAGNARPLGPVPVDEHGQIVLSDPAEALFAQVVGFGVSVERTGESPDRPGGAFVYQGTCGRLWRSPPPVG